MFRKKLKSLWSAENFEEYKNVWDVRRSRNFCENKINLGLA
jgi:hypothetical protein